MSRSSFQVCWRQFASLGLGWSLFTNPPKGHACPLADLVISTMGLQSIKKAPPVQMRSGSLSDWLSADCRRAGVSLSRHVGCERCTWLEDRREVLAIDISSVRPDY